MNFARWIDQILSIALVVIMVVGGLAVLVSYWVTRGR